AGRLIVKLSAIALRLSDWRAIMLMISLRVGSAIAWKTSLLILQWHLCNHSVTNIGNLLVTQNFFLPLKMGGGGITGGDTLAATQRRGGYTLSNGGNILASLSLFFSFFSFSLLVLVVLVVADHPLHSKLVGKHAEEGAPELFAQRHYDLAASRQGI